MQMISVMNLIIALVGVITGVSGLVLGLLNFFRDKPNIQVQLSWDMVPFGNAKLIYDEEKMWGQITVTNVGRRPVFISHAHLEIPGKENLLITKSIRGEKLLEGDPPTTYPITQEGLEFYSKEWRCIRAVVIDSVGKKYYSSYLANAPSWSKSKDVIADS